MENKFLNNFQKNDWAERFVNLQRQESAGIVLSEEEKLFLAKVSLYARFFPDSFADAVLSNGLSMDVLTKSEPESPRIMTHPAVHRQTDDLHAAAYTSISVAAATDDREEAPKTEEATGFLVYNDIYHRVMKAIGEGSATFGIRMGESDLVIFHILEDEQLKPVFHPDYSFNIEQKDGDSLVVDEIGSTGKIPAAHLKNMKLAIRKVEIVLRLAGKG